MATGTRRPAARATRPRTRKHAVSWTTATAAALIGWSAWLWATHLEELPTWLVFITGFAGGALTATTCRYWLRRLAKRVGIQVTRVGGRS